MRRWARARVVGVMGGLGLWLSLSALAQDYEIRLHRPDKVGQKYRQSATGSEKLTLVVSLDGEVVERKSEDMTVEFESEVTVLQVDKDGQATKESHSVIKCEVVRNGAREALLAPGLILTATADDNETKFEAQGGRVAPEVAEALQLVISIEKDAGNDDDAIGTRERKKIGESWHVNPEAVAQDLRRQKVEVTKQSVSGTVTLAGLVKVGGIDCLDVRGTMTLKDIRPPLEEGFRVDNSDARITFSMKPPVDLTIGRIEEAMKMTLNLRATGRVKGQEGEATLVLTSEKSGVFRRTYPK